ncbi:uncharacterized protein LOC114813843 isoform X2 [Ornithorhynchus anatinus]|uniref:uncharacterized protein LOC114813843 isoform X2 n=1 Tax=Ornithorhynchus anatinus TaxID=9258 RepID=UPI0010A75CA0|nr:uncharacterized protein LOC114813843 isoform X2 [Ornithorhynchus anatinus]
MEGDWCGRAELLLETVRSVQQRSVPPQFGRPDRPLPHGRWTCPRSALQMAQMDLREGEAPSPSAHLGDPAGAHPPRCSIWEEEPRESLRRQHPRERAGEAGLALGIAEAFRERTSKGRLSARFPSRTSHPGPPRDEPDPDAVDDRGSRRRFKLSFHSKSISESFKRIFLKSKLEEEKISRFMISDATAQH